MSYEVPDQSGKLAIVTGANSGTGKEAARKLAGAGATVILAVRTVAKGEKAKRDILAQHPEADVQVRRIDLADLASVREFADSVIADGRAVDVLLNNAGVMFPPVRHETVDGFELQMGSNFFGPFALTVRLLPMLLKAKAPRVVTMSSGMAARGKIDFEDLNWTRSYDPTGAYGRSKLADLLLSQQLARLATKNGWNLLSLGAHPGNSATGIADAGPRMGGKPSLLFRVAWKLTPQHSAEAGADPMLYAATAADVKQGGYYGPRWNLVGKPVPAKFTPKGQDEKVAERLWNESEHLTGVTAV
ncbi:SDR family oxidoreductase [Rhodococcus sp. T2V]|uniref:SDR family oxidoreductase n=1 Tax=Rhodococcus sp. T2V TaxID=3034164 RepID=UPI0023E1AE2E|nr:SDR family oxidoreductase [Rhodococcus sp. T2V]MDF3309678.1 SDR family oxidoreductase [Rhodococcus sp. T2V]